RRRVSPRSELYVKEPLPVRGVIALAPAAELPTLYEQGVFEGVVGKLMGGSPQEFPERYGSVTPASLAPLGVSQALIVGAHDDVWGWNARAYYEKARAAGDEGVTLQILETAGHFEVIAPHTQAWRSVVAAARGLLLA